MRFPVFANDLRRALAAKVDVERSQQLDHLLPAPLLVDLQLSLSEPLQKTTAGLTERTRVGIDPLQELVGD
jgi:hypothetical protein